MKTGANLAFDALFDRYHQALYKNIFRLVRNNQVAADILQDTFVALWQNRDKLDPNQSVSGWLFQVSYRNSISYLRKKQREEAALQDFPFEIEHHQSDQYEYQVRLLNSAMARLSTQKRRVFTLCKLEGKTYDETASVMGLSRHTVKEYLSSAVTSIKEFIRTHPDVSGYITVILLLRCFLL
ncbi:RNA polymerase sigma factor [Parapedobacter indicus]|uniref:RNA polymerase sigma-70 factor, ECF subfamily n=1 Tax=Parapedobacter indicus TaxID=1477437 RepID=A0A1I3FDB5_9SPHI|nr:sigma-70 family RNA polymerase sigma factor [Parapedobacter indicus]PPL03666.1 RNA polymerase sigma-70 factor (ECF subfamily) [Parapedobacter indicus]SFI09170.1 RNA polymerase sigma-70 factor, ECF subfamily [Parapedobacter indicus]